MTSMPLTQSRADQGKRHDADAIAAAVGGGPGIDDDRADQSLAHLLAQPLKMLGVAVVHGTGTLDLDRQDGAIFTSDDQIDLVVAVACAEVPDVGFSSLRRNADAQCRQRLEHASEHGPLFGPDRTASSSQELRFVQAEETSGERGIGEVMLRRTSESRELAAAELPSGHRIEKP